MVGCNKINNCTTDNCEFLDILEGKNSRIQTVLYRDLPKSEEFEEIDRINQNYDKILNILIRKYQHDQRNNHINDENNQNNYDGNDYNYDNNNQNDYNQNEYNNHDGYDHDDTYNEDHQNTDAPGKHDYQSNVENGNCTRACFEEDDNQDYSPNNTQNTSEQENETPRPTNCNENVNRTVTMTEIIRKI